MEPGDKDAALPAGLLAANCVFKSSRQSVETFTPVWAPKTCPERKTSR